MLKFPSLRKLGIKKIRVSETPTPENVEIKPVKGIDSVGVKFRGLKRALAGARNSFKRNKI